MSQAIIAQRVYSYIPDTVLLLGQGEFTRKLALGNGWFRIRLGFLASLPVFDPLNNTALIGMQCHFGMCSSYGDGSSSSACANFIGASLMGNANTIQNLNYNTDSSSPYPYYTSTGNPQAFGRFGNTFVTAAQSGSTPIWVMNSRGAKRRNAYIVDITRPVGGSGACTVSFHAGNVQSNDWTPDRLFDAIDNITAAPTIFGMTMTTYLNASAINWGEATGPLDSIDLWYMRSVMPMEISAIGASVLDSFYSQQTWSGFAEFFAPTTGNSGTFAPPHPPVWSYGTLLSGTFQPFVTSGPVITQGSATNLSPYVNCSGTSCGPCETFQSYGTGTVLSGSTLIGSAGFTSPAIVYAW